MPSCEERIYSNDYYDFLIDYMVEEIQYSNLGLDYCYAKISNLLSVVFVQKNNVPPFSLSEYSYRFVPKLYVPMETVSFPLLKSGILQVQNEPLELTGRNVVIGIADSGIDYRNPAFRRPDGSSRILAIWDQTIPYSDGRSDAANRNGSIGNRGSGNQNGSMGNPDFGNQNDVQTTRLSRWNDDSIVERTSMDVPFGTVFTREEIDFALGQEAPLDYVPTVDETGHGTAMACAAGGYVLPGRVFSGQGTLNQTTQMPPGQGTLEQSEQILGGAIDAEFVIVKCKDAKAYLRDYYFVPDGVTAYSDADIMMAYRFIDSYQILFERPVVYALGLGSNSGAHDGSSVFSEFLNGLTVRRGRAAVVCGGNEGNQRLHFRGFGDMDAELRVGNGENGFVLEIWGEIPGFLSLQVTSPGGESTPFLEVNNNQTRVYRFIYERTILQVDSELIEQSSGKELVVIRFAAPTAGVWTLRVRGNQVFHMWLPVRSLLTGDTYFLKPEPDRTITEPGYAEGVITVSAYQDSNNSIWSESGRGYRRTSPASDVSSPDQDLEVREEVIGGRQKPDLAVPGVDVPVVESTSAGNYVRLEKTGTSLSAAITAGAVAQLLQWAIIEGNDSNIKSREVKSYLQIGADQDAGTIYPNNQWGYGRLNLQGVFDVISQIR